MTGSAKNSLTSLRGVGPKLAETLGKLGINEIQDLLFHLPLRYEDRTRLHPIGSLLPNTRVLIEGNIQHAAIVRGRRPMLVVVLNDGTGRITLRFFHFRASQKQQMKTGSRLRCFGEVKPGYQGLEMIHPSYSHLRGEQAVADRLTPVYPTTEGLGQANWIKLTDQALTQLRNQALQLEELLPSSLLDSMQLPELAQAIDFIHRPTPEADTLALEERRHPAQQRLAMEELLAHNLSMQKLHRQQRSLQAACLDRRFDQEDAFLQRLPFQLTGAQQRVVSEILADLEKSHPMLRLIQGDVGSGKTVVAALAALRTLGNGWQTAITAPTELLAEQHLKSFAHWFEFLGITPVWLSSKVTGKARAKALEAIVEGAPLVIGTHALMQEGVQFKRLGLVIIDEQHRFGVHQRLSLRNKGQETGIHPHQMIMTATPIPRTLAMTAYAGLEVSVIDELPPGRKAVTTVTISSERRDEVISRVAAACEKGRQAYWVCTLIEESDALEAQAAEVTAETLSAALPQLKIGLIHGRLKAAEKQRIMEAFKSGELHLLVATTVIEVGVDVPNASLMIIENAERMGLAQLHQLRGRVGRGDQQSSCVLLYQQPLSQMAQARLNILRDSNDGFRIAEKDLELRGPGEVLGTRQTGMVQFRVADLGRDQYLLDKIPAAADQLLSDHPQQVEALIQRWIGQARDYAEV